MLDLKEVSQILGVGEGTIKDWIHKNKLKCTYVDKNIFFNKREIQRFIKETNIKLVKPKDAKKRS